jgi:hypothetical protein
MKAAKLGAIFMVSVMALAGVGVAYSHWIDEINIEYTIDMGKLGFGFVSQYTNDPPPNYENGALKPDPEGPDQGYYDPDQPEGRDRECGEDLDPHPTRPKNVAYTECTMHTQKVWHDGTLMEHEGDPVYQYIHVELYNVYPNYAPNLYFDIANAGTIPVDITGQWLIDDGIDGNDFAEPDDFTTWFWMDICTIYQFDLYPDPDDCPDIEMGLFRTAPDMQIDPCERDEYGISFHILQCYPECTTTQFEFKIFGVQWNWPNLPPGTPYPTPDVPWPGVDLPP